MRTAYLDISNGINASMLLGALVDAGLDVDGFSSELDKLKIGYKLNIKKTYFNGGNKLVLNRNKEKQIPCVRVDVECDDHQKSRTFSEINSIVDNSELDVAVKEKVKKIFFRLAEVESKIHNTSLDKVHFHEIGSLSNILAVVGVVCGLEKLGVKKIISSPFSVGTGFIECSHGRIPLPCPATAVLIEGKDVVKKDIPYELTTPTGAAIVHVLVDGFGEINGIKAKIVGSGAGKYVEQFENILQLAVE